MSETTADAAPHADAEPVVAVAPADDAPAPAEAASEAPAPAEGTETQAAETETDKPKPRGDRRFAQLLAKTTEAQRRAEEAERRAAAAEALLAARGTEGDAPEPKHGSDEARVRAAAQQLRDEETFNARRAGIVADGVKAFGESDWNEKTNIVAAYGAIANPVFLDALIEMPNAPAIVAALADEPEKIAALLAKRPAAMAAELGRMAAELSAPKPKAVSTAPKPATPISGRSLPEPNMNDTSLSMREWVALRNKQAPQHLGGMRKPS